MGQWGSGAVGWGITRCGVARCDGTDAATHPSTMSSLKFQPSPKPTLGVEVELALVDAETMALRSAAPKLLDRLPQALRESVKPELMQCYVEINSAVCNTVADAERDLADKLRVLRPAA